MSGLKFFRFSSLTALVLSAAAFILPAGTAAQSLSNEFINVRTDHSTGRFMIKTTGGDPSMETDDNKNLLYEDIPPTSFTTVRIDGKNYIFGSQDGKFIMQPSQQGDNLIATWEIKGIEITQTINLVSGITTGNPDNMQIKYFIKNNDKNPKEVGLRVLFDTLLGWNDGAPFSIPGAGSVTSETEFYGSDIPDFWYAIDSISNPTVKSQGRLSGMDLTKPDYLAFACWSRFSDNPWKIDIKAGKTFKRNPFSPLDSAVALFWEPKTLDPGKTISYMTEYGLFGTEVKKGPLLNVSISGPVVSVFYPFTIVCDIENGTSTKYAYDMSVRLKLPNDESLKVLNDEFKTAKLKPAEISKVSWSVLPGKMLSGPKEYTIEVTFWDQETRTPENMQTITLSRKILMIGFQEEENINMQLEELNRKIKAKNKNVTELNESSDKIKLNINNINDKLEISNTRLKELIDRLKAGDASDTAAGR